MSKLEQLLAQIGASEELTQAICEELRNHEKAVKAKNAKELRERLERAKKVCIEEVEAEKTRLARKVEIFLESKVGHIERAAAKRLAIEEAGAVDTLKKVKSLTEGIEIDGSKNGDPQVTETVKKLRRQVATLTEQRDTAVKKANRANEIAQGVLKKNALLEAKLAPKEDKSSRTIVESRSDRSERLVGLRRRRRPARPMTTRPTLEESQSPLRDEENERRPILESTGTLTVEDIAAGME